MHWVFRYSTTLAITVWLTGIWIAAWTIDNVVRFGLRENWEQREAIGSFPHWRCLDVADGLPGSQVRYFAKDPTGGFYLILDRGWCRLEGTSVLEYEQPGDHLPAFAGC